MFSFYAFLSRSHRAVLIIATATLSIGGSVVASDPRSIQNWMLLLGGCALLFAADELSEIEIASRDLATSTGRRPADTRADVMSARGAKGLIATIILAVTTIVVAYSWPFIVAAYDFFLVDIPWMPSNLPK